MALPIRRPCRFFPQSDYSHISFPPPPEKKEHLALFDFNYSFLTVPDGMLAIGV